MSSDLLPRFLFAVLISVRARGVGAPVCSLERDVVVDHGISRGLGGRGRVAATASTTAATLATRAHELDIVSDDLDLGALVAIGGLPLAPTKLAFDGDLRALAEEARQ